MKKLIIAEKPSVASDIAKVLKAKKVDDYYENDAYVVSSALGHLVELNMPADIDKKYARWTLSNLPIIPETFKLKPIEKTKAKLQGLKKTACAQRFGRRNKRMRRRARRRTDIYLHLRDSQMQASAAKALGFVHDSSGNIGSL